MLPQIGKLGAATEERIAHLLGMFGLAYAAVKGAWVERKRGRRLVLETIAKQVYFTTIQPLPFFALAALIFGFVIIVQSDQLLHRFHLDYFLPPLVVTGICREVAPLVIAMILIGRSGPAIATELGYMTLNREVEALSFSGINTDYFLVFPRIVGVTLATVFMHVVFCATAIVGGYLLGKTLGLVSGTLLFGSIVDALTVSTVVFSVLKAAVFGATIAVANCFHGLSVVESFTEIPKANVRGAQLSLVTCFAANALISIYASSSGVGGAA